MRWHPPDGRWHTSRWADLIVRSNMDLPRLRPAEASADVTFEWDARAPVPKVEVVTRTVRWVDGSESIVQRGRAGDVALLRVGELGTYLVDVPGTVVTFVPEGAPDPMRVEHTFVNTVLGMFAAMRGGICLHAAAVESGGAATVFVGPSGAGKSTRARREVERGARLLSDDATVLTATSGQWLAWPGAGTIRVAADAPAGAWDILGKKEWVPPLAQDPAPVVCVVLVGAPGGSKAEVLRSLCGVHAAWQILGARERAVLAEVLANLLGSVEVRVEPRD